MPQERGKARVLDKSMVGGTVGNILEWYDFAVFGYFASVIEAQFFPGGDHLASTIKAFGVFAAGYLMRPLGGVIFGHIGDRLGRKKALMISVALMAIPTTCLGLLPTHAQAGVWASLLLVFLRLLQGLSVGGELIGSISFITESAPRKQRGFLGSFSLCGAVAGVLLGSLVATLVHAIFSSQAISGWAWRVPFWCGFGVALFCMWMRKGLAETPAFERLKREQQLSDNPVGEALRNHLSEVLNVAGLVAVMGAGFYLCFVWWPTYLTKIVHPPIGHALLINTISMTVFMLLIPLMGRISDSMGRRGVIMAACLGILALSYPLFVLTDHAVMANALLAQLVFAVLISATQGPMPAAMVEMFPTRTRFSGVALGYNLSIGLVGGTTPLIATWLADVTKNPASPAYYLILLAAVSLYAAWRIQPNISKADA